MCAASRSCIGTRKKGGYIPILSRRVGTSPTRLNRPIGINNDPIVHGVVAASSRRSTLLSGAPVLVQIFMYY